MVAAYIVFIMGFEGCSLISIYIYLKINDMKSIEAYEHDHELAG